MLELGGKPLHARLFASSVLERGLRSLDRATDLPLELRDRLAGRFLLEVASILEVARDRDGTRKFLLRLLDGETIEMVLIPEGRRSTLCISSQVGCPVGCVFCASGLFGVRRNLGRAEIVEQFLLARDELGDRPLTNLVVMGLGEPMLNLGSLLPALRMISNPRGLAFSSRRITISTSGFPDRIRELARSGGGYELAVSLHAANPDLRRELVPTAREDPEDLVLAAMDHRRVTGRDPTFEVVLIAGRNDGPEQAAELAALLARRPCTVNLIPWNRVEELGQELRSPTDPAVRAFRRTLEATGLNVTVRRRRGRRSEAACGQLRLRKE